MVTVANLVETAIDSLRDIVSGKPSTDQSSPHLEATMLTQAIKAIERDEGFSDNELMDAVLAIENNLKRVETYLSLGSKGTRTLYLRHHMGELKKYD